MGAKRDRDCWRSVNTFQIQIFCVLHLWHKEFALPTLLDERDLHLILLSVKMQTHCIIYYFEINKDPYM